MTVGYSPFSAQRPPVLSNDLPRVMLKAINIMREQMTPEGTAIKDERSCLRCTSTNTSEAGGAFCGTGLRSQPTWYDGLGMPRFVVDAMVRASATFASV